MSIHGLDLGLDAGPAALLGGVALSRLRVYGGRAQDGLAGGSPHCHLACAEAYVVLGGAGSVELLGPADGYRRVDLRPGDALQFDPGVVHRLVNDGELEILVLMQNAGLPENGDAVFTFPPDDLRDAETYRGHAEIGSLEDALARRDRAVAGMTLLRDAFARSTEEGRSLLAAFHRRAAELVEPAVPGWQEIVERGPAAAVARTLERLRDLAAGVPLDLRDARAVEIAQGPERLGMCGRLQPFGPEGTALGR